MISSKLETIYKRVVMRVFLPGNKKSVVVQNVAPPGRGFSATAIDSMLDEMGKRIEKQYPDQEYRMVALSPNRFNFVWECAKEDAS
jgi:hypothetical protein